MELDDLIARVRAGRRSTSQAPDGAREAIYQTALARAMGDVRVGARRKPWLRILAVATPVAVAAAFLLAFLVPLPYVHVGGNKPVATASTSTASTTRTNHTSTTIRAPKVHPCQAQAAGVAYLSVDVVTSLYPKDSRVDRMDAVDLADGKLLWSLQLPGGSIDSMAVAADGELFAVIATQTGAVHLDRISTTSGHILKSISLQISPPLEQGLAVSPDRHWALVVESGAAPINLPSNGSDDVLAVDLLTGQVESQINLNGDPDAVRFVSNTLAYLTQTNDEVVPIEVPSWSLGPAIRLPSTPGEDDQSGPMAFSSDGSTAVVMTQGADLAFPARKAFVVNLRSGVVHTVHVAVGGADSLALSCDGAVAYTVSDMSLIRTDLRNDTSRILKALPPSGGVVANQGASPYIWLAVSAPPYTNSTITRYVGDSSHDGPAVASVAGDVTFMVVAPPSS